MKKKLFSTIAAIAVGTIVASGLAISPSAAFAGDGHEHAAEGTSCSGEKSCSGDKCSQDCKSKCSGERKSGEGDCSCGSAGCGGEKK